MGSKRFLNLAFIIFILPNFVYNEPLRAIRVGATQSKVSQPFSTPKIKSTGSPTPKRWRGFSCGKISLTHLTAVAISSLTKDPPTPNPPKSAPPALPRPNSPLTWAPTSTLSASPVFSRIWAALSPITSKLKPTKSPRPHPGPTTSKSLKTTSKRSPASTATTICRED